MKTLLIVGAILLLILFITQSFVSRSSKKTETHAYTVLKVYEGFEIRKYQPALFSGVKLSGKTYKESSSSGFRILAGYIFGNNEKNEKIAMTTPVVMQLGDTVKMYFKVPDGYTKEELPQPSNNKILFENQAEKVMAVVRFSGWADDENIKLYTEQLKAALAKENIPHNNTFCFLGYNPPYELLNRRNEIAVELPNYLQ